MVEPVLDHELQPRRGQRVERRRGLELVAGQQLAADDPRVGLQHGRARRLARRPARAARCGRSASRRGPSRVARGRCRCRRAMRCVRYSGLPRRRPAARRLTAGGRCRRGCCLRRMLRTPISTSSPSGVGSRSQPIAGRAWRRVKRASRVAVAAVVESATREHRGDGDRPERVATASGHAATSSRPPSGRRAIPTDQLCRPGARAAVNRAALPDDANRLDRRRESSRRFTFFVLRPLNDLVHVCCGESSAGSSSSTASRSTAGCAHPSSARSRRWQNARRTDEHLALAEECVPDDEERNIRAVIDEISAFTRENYPPGGAQRFGNSKTYGVLRAEFTVLDGPPGAPAPRALRRAADLRGLRAARRAGPVRAGRPATTYGQCSMGIKVMGVDGPKLMEDEQHTQDLILVTPASFVTPDIRENAKLQKWVRRKADFMYFMNPLRLARAPHDLPGALLPHADEPARGAVLHQRPVPARRGPGRAVLGQAVLTRARQDPRRAGGELPPRGARARRSRRARGRSTSWCRCRRTRSGCRSRTRP